VIERIDIYKINYDEANHPVNVRMYYQWQKSGENSRKPEIEINVNELTDIYSKIENNIPVKGPIEDYKKSALLRSYRGDYNQFVILSLRHKSDLWGFMVFLMKEGNIKWMGDDLLSLMEHASKITEIIRNEELIASLMNSESEYRLLTHKGIDIYLRVDKEFIIKAAAGREIEDNSVAEERFIGRSLKELLLFPNNSERNKYFDECLMCAGGGKSFKRNLLLNAYEPEWYSVQCYSVNKNNEMACAATKIDDVVRPLKETELWLGLHNKMFGNMRNVIIVMTPDEVLYVSPNIFEMTGLEAETIRKGFLSNNPEIFDRSTMESILDVLHGYRQGNNAKCCFKGRVIQGASFLGDVEIFINTIDSTVSGNNQLLMLEIENTFDREEFERLAAIIDRKYEDQLGAGTFVYMLGIDGSILWANKDAETFFAMETGSPHKNIVNYFEDEHRDAVMRSIMSPLVIKRRSDIVNHRLLSANEEIEAITLSSPAYSKGAPHAVLCVSKRVKRNISALGHQQDMVIEDMTSEFRWAMDMDLYFTYVSPSVKHILGYTRERAMREGLGSVLSDKSDEKLGKCLKAGLIAAKKNKPWSKTIPVEFIGDNGRTIKGKMIMNLVYDNGKPVSFVGVTEIARKRI
ncbi:MAG: PAS domain-containing protein, partial [Syntrophorhabdus sp.]